ncbi:MAG: oligosaccharide flippase family protein [Candidatus Pacearchaeota archaeon]|jgi:O-antigen/teichoic acid export membrane protein
MDFLDGERTEVKGLFNKLKKRDFSGTSGQVLRNSSYQLATILISKIASLFFTIIIARLMLPELFGLYTLTLSTIAIFSSFSDLGIGSALITFVSKFLDKRQNKKAKSFFKVLMKYKIYLSLTSSFLLVIFSYYLSNIYYNKPIFLALLVGGLYLFIFSFLEFLNNLYKSNNNFKYPFFKEVILQILRFCLVPIGILFLLKNSLSNEIVVFGVILILTICYSCATLFLILFSKKKISFLKEKSVKLSNKDKINLRKFILPLSTMALSGVFFGYIDIIMLGHFVSEEFIGYYSASFSLITSAAAIIGFVGASILPIFSRIKKDLLEKTFKKSIIFTLIISLLGAIFSFSFAFYIIKIVYGLEYFNSIILLKIFSLMLLMIPISSIYEAYFISQERTKSLALFLILSTLLNIILNYFFITFGLKFGFMQAVIGACVATIISRFFYVISLALIRKKK